jgi:antitoxin component YwqK of YwqJK toxin-antitoxin module
MIKYILSTGIGMLLCSIAISQQLSDAVDPVEINSSPDNSVVVNTNDKEKKRFDLPAEGKIIAHVNETILYSGKVKKHRLHGIWQSWYSNSNPCDSGAFVKGVPTGEWKHWDINGQLLSVRSYDAGKLSRVKDEIRRNHPKDVVFPLTALHKKNSRRAKYYMHAGYSFDFIDHHPHDFSLQQAVANNITPGNKYRPLFDECLHHGLYMNFYENGIVKDSGYYKYGLKESLWIHRDTDGSYVFGVYKNGLRQKDWKRYNSKGKLIAIIFYNRKGEEQWRKRY